MTATGGRVDGSGGEEGGRTLAEWTSLAICSAVLVTVLALLASQLTGSSQPARPAASVVEVRPGGSASYVVVEVVNGGDETAVDVQVSASLTVGDEVEEADVVVPFLGGGEAEEVVFAFTGDPDDGELEVAVTAFADP